MKSITSLLLSSAMMFGCSAFQLRGQDILLENTDRTQCVSLEESFLDERVGHIFVRYFDIRGSSNPRLERGMGFVLDDKRMITAGHVLGDPDKLNSNDFTKPRYWFYSNDFEMEVEVNQKEESNDVATFFNRDYRGYLRIPTLKPRMDMEVFYRIPYFDGEHEAWLKERTRMVGEYFDSNVEFTSKYMEVRGSVLTDFLISVDQEQKKVYPLDMLAFSGDSGSPVFTEQNGCLYIVGVLRSAQVEITVTESEKVFQIGGRAYMADLPPFVTGR